jgi:hypothetical protein
MIFMGCPISCGLQLQDDSTALSFSHITPLPTVTNTL